MREKGQREKVKQEGRGWQSVTKKRFPNRTTRGPSDSSGLCLTLPWTREETHLSDRLLSDGTRSEERLLLTSGKTSQLRPPSHTARLKGRGPRRPTFQGGLQGSVGVGDDEHITTS